MNEPIPIFMLVYQRPLYLWACLDGFYRNTQHPYRLVIADNASPDPGVRDVLRGFERRGMFHKLYLCEDNSPDRIGWMIARQEDILGKYFVIADSDVIVERRDPCWLSKMVQIMEDSPNMGILGSLIDTSDFVSLEDARRAEPDMDEETLKALIKANSPERTVDEMDTDPEVIRPFNPPGRLMLIRSSALKTVAPSRDSIWNSNMKKHGYDTGIATKVIHRHLSVLNFYDYLDYDTKWRDEFMASINKNNEVVQFENPDGSNKR